MNQTNKPHRNFRFFYHDQSGVVLLLVTILLPLFLCFVALAVDVGHLMVVRNELQTAADAAALAGAQKFYPEPVKEFSTTLPTPDWEEAEAAGSANAPPNQSDGFILNSYEVQSGYWNLNHPAYGLQSQSITPTSDDTPALQVTVRRTSGKNNGSVLIWFAGIIGIKTTDVSATATAVYLFIKTVKPDTLLSLVVPLDVASQAPNYYDAEHPINIGSSYHYPDVQESQWTSFKDQSNSPSLDYNSTTLSVGDNIWIQPGTETKLYKDMIDQNFIGKDVVLAVVLDIPTTPTKGWEPIVGFIGFHIMDIKGGSEKYISGYFTNSIVQGSWGTGTSGQTYYGGAHSPPVLVK